MMYGHREWEVSLCVLCGLFAGRGISRQRLRPGAMVAHLLSRPHRGTDELALRKLDRGSIMNLSRGEILFGAATERMAALCGAVYGTIRGTSWLSDCGT